MNMQLYKCSINVRKETGFRAFSVDRYCLKHLKCQQDILVGETEQKDSDADNRTVRNIIRNAGNVTHSE